MIRKGSMILSSVFFPKTSEFDDFSKERQNFIEILKNNEKVRKIVNLMIKDDKDNYCVKIRFCSSVLQYEAIIGVNNELERKMKKGLHDIFLNNSLFKINSNQKDLIKMKDELIDLFLKDEYVLNVLKEL